MDFCSDYALLRTFLDRGCISCSPQDSDELRQFGPTCSGVNDFWTRAQNPMWLIEFLNFMRYRNTPGLEAFALESASRVKHLVDAECWEHAMHFVRQRNREENRSSRASESESYNEWFQRTRSFPRPQGSAGNGAHQSARGHAYDVARTLVMEDALASSEFAVRSAALAVSEEAEESKPGTGEGTRTQFLSEMADRLREMVRLPSTPEEDLTWRGVVTLFR